MDLRTPKGRQELGKRIQAAVADTDYDSLPAFARHLGCSRALIYQYVKGDVLVQLDRLQEIADLTGRPLAWFLLGESGLEGSDAQQLRAELDRCREATTAAEQALAHERGRRAAETDQYRHTLAQDLREICLAYRHAEDAAALLEACPRWLEIARALGDQSALAAAHLHMGHAWYQVGNLDMALRALQEALRLAQDTADLPAEYSARQELVRVLQGLGRSAEAREQALPLTTAERWWPRWAALVALAALEEQTGHLPAAEQALDQAAAVVDSGEESPDRRALARAYLASNRVNLALARGHYHLALALSDNLHALASAADLPDQIREAALDTALADLRTGRLAAAGDHLERLQEWSALAGDQRLALLASLFHTEYLRRCGDLPAAKREALAALEQAAEGSSGHPLAEAELAVGEVYRAEGKTEEALHYLQRCRARAQRLELHRLATRAALSLALLEDSAPDARQQLRDIARLAKATGYDDLQAECLVALSERARSARSALKLAQQAAALSSAAGDFWGELAAALAAAAAHLRLGELTQAAQLLIDAHSRRPAAPCRPDLTAAERSLQESLLAAFATAEEPAPPALRLMTDAGNERAQLSEEES